MEKTDGLFQVDNPSSKYAFNLVRGSYVFPTTYENENRLQKNGGQRCSEYVKPSRESSLVLHVENFMHVTGALQMTWDSRFFSGPPVSSLVDGSM